MKRLNVILILLCIIINMMNAQNPFFEKYTTPYGTVPFDKIKTEHYEPAIREGIRQQAAEIDAIVNNPEVPTFANTILAYEKSGELLDRVTTVFGNLRSAETNDDLQTLAQEMMPLLSEHSNNISLNEELFKRVKAVYNQKEQLNLTPEQTKLLENIYDGFIRRGANLQGEAKKQYRQLTKELSSLTLQFSENNLKEINNYQLVLTDKAQLAGLPESAIEAAAETAKEKGVEGWVFTLQAPSYIPFMTYADNRDLRHELYMAYNTKCTHNNEYNNIDIVKKLVNTRMAIAQLLGYENFAQYTLKKRMAEDSDAVYNLLNQLLEAYTPTAKKEYQEVQELARQEQGAEFTVMPWDWSYYSNKLKDKKFNINEEMLRPYFELEKVKEGVFGLATRLYGITFKKNADIPVYHKDVDAYEVLDKDNKTLAILYTDFHPRTGKRAGAWMTEYKGQWIDEKTGENSRPHVSIVMNFTKPTGNKPALLTFDEVETFLHEFGHSLHGMFANSTYESLSGTSVYWDFVELPSQIMENFAIEKEFLNTFAQHYQTDEKLPEELIKRLVDASNFNAAYACLRQVSFGLLDMAWYTRNTPFEGDVKEYEQQSWAKAQILPVVKDACMSTQFSHIFAGGYSAGYYSYKWAEVLDADAFSLFKQKGIFNREVAESFRNNILSKGGTEHPMILYKRFRGQEPTIDALLIRNGIKENTGNKKTED
ncbi:M3 family metallopeptidase [Bacteroides nordii]|uniref:M3 family metallopeptidase n=1 Tax=Bacteroides nordii TaxID=291645 RepID=UPI001E2965A8|nr:M3 family metallopeptidase [Bacteroides nordii]